MIGLDFPKIEFELFGLELLEPMAIITDSIMGGLSVYFGIKIFGLRKQIDFYKFWALFFLIFGIGSIIGGVGHTFYNQLGLFGKIPSWVSGPIAVYFAERAMISLYWKAETKTILLRIFNAKLILVYCIFLFLLLTNANPDRPNLPFLPVAINTIVGMIATVGVLGFKYTETLSAKFKFFWLGVMIMFPTAIIFLFKINVHQWFDKNDFSHILLTIGIVYWYLGVTKLANGLKPSLV
jgi:hypothetical protein